jgi:hypothetical protein
MASMNTPGDLAPGRAVGRRYAARRGSFLVLVVGVLVLLAVISLVYVSIGRSDRQTSAALEASAEARRVPGEMRDYIRDVIGQDVFDRYHADGRGLVEGQPLALNSAREAWDYPSTAFFEQSWPQAGLGRTADQPRPVQIRPAGNAVRFNPTGDGTGTDPWLASSVPTFIGSTGLNPEPTNDPRFPVSGSNPRFLRETDWGNITNISPDGHAVNLWALRTARAGGPQNGGFDADADLLRRDLSVFDHAGVVTPLTAPGAGVERERWQNYPAALSSNQVRAFRRVLTDPAPGSGPYTANNGQFWAGYQWADTDGDGVYDARYFEMVDASRSANPRDWVRSVANDANLRWFFAVRVEDLSAAVNVNTASDFRGETVAGALPGGTPGDVDLLRLLTQFDLGLDYGTDLYGSLFQPQLLGPARVVNPQRVQDYTEYTLANALGWNLGLNAFRELGRSFDRGRVSTRDDGLVTIFNANPVERAQRFLTRSGQPLGLLFDASTAGSEEVQVGNVSRVEDLAELKTFETVNDPRTTSRLEAAVSPRVDLTSFPGSSATTNRRFDPLRSNRSLEVERDSPGMTDRQALNRQAVDVRQHLTTDSGARPLRSATLSEARDPEQKAKFGDTLGRFELKVDALDLLEKSDLRGLFRAYADVLLPYADRPGVWPTGVGGGTGGALSPATRTMFYGHQGPEFALYCAAALTVNLMDSYDADNTPTAATLIVNEDPSSSPSLYPQLVNDAQNATFGGRQFGWSAVARDNSVVPVRRSGATWVRDGARVPLKGLLDLNRWYEPAPEARGPLNIPADQTPVRVIGPNPTDGGVNRLGRSAGAARSRAVTMFGIEAQPFLTEAATLFFYADKPSGVAGSTPNGADTDTVKVRDGVLGSNGILRGGSSTGNNAEDFKDLIFQALAIQLTNPFSFPVELTAGDSQYYLEFGGRYFMLQSRAIDPATGALGPATIITLEPHETAVFFALNEDPDEIVDVLENIRSDPDTRRGRLTDPITPANLLEWITAQFKVNGQLQRQVSAGAISTATIGTGPAPRLIPFYDPLTGSIRESGRRDAPMTISVLSADAAQNREVRLWRRVVNTDGGETASTNSLANDQLMDRMHDPNLFTPGNAVATLDRSINLFGNAIGDSNNAEHAGLAFTTWASIRRPNGNAGGAGTADFQTPVGGVPAYAIELKPSNAVTSLNTVQRWPAGSGQVRQLDVFGDFDRTEARIEFGELWLGQIASGMVGRITDRAEAKTGADIRPNLSGQSFNSLNAQIWLDNQRFERPVPGNPGFTRSIIRVGDLLLPLAVAPMFDPDNAEPEGGWTTLSEALSRVLDYDGTWATAAVGNGFRRMGFDDVSGSSIDEGTLFRGRLWLDRYSPFYDANENGVFDPSTANEQERPMGSGGPLAWRVFDVFAPMHRLRNGAGAVAGSEAYGSMVTATPGLVNISTAPLNVLRTLPMLSPDATPGVWWWPGGTHGPSTDVAATLRAFRDKQPEDPRGAAPSASFWFRDGTLPGEVPLGRRTFASGPLSGAESDLLSLQSFNEFPGFRALSEAFGARFPAFAGGSPDQHSINRLGRDAKATGQPVGPGSAVDMPILLPDGAGGLGDWYAGYTDGTGTRPDNYAEQLTLMNAVAGAASVRSDFYVAWFVAVGFRRADIESLASPTDPLVPSVRRRFLMVVDRSNVTTRTDRARVVLFREVPF